MKPIKIRVMDVRRETIYQTRQLTSLFLDWTIRQSVASILFEKKA
jgi:hypothetical protein